MQMAYTPKAWVQERASWKAVIQLNLIRSINTIVDALADEIAYQSSNPPSSPSSPSSDEGHGPVPEQALIPQNRRGSLMKLRMRLTPLRQVETDLKARLGCGSDEIMNGDPLSTSMDAMMATPFDGSAYSPSSRRFNPKDVAVRSHRAWKEREKARKEKDRSIPRPTSPGSASDKRDSATEVVTGCAEDMAALWSDPVVREIIRKRRLMSNLGDSAE